MRRPELGIPGRDLVSKWVHDLKCGRRITGRAKFVYGAGLEVDKQGKKLVIPAITLPIVEKNLEALAEVIVRLDKALKDARPEANALARQRSALIDSQVDDGPVDYRSAGLEAVDQVLNHSPSADEVTLEDREETLLEANRNWDNEVRLPLAIDALDIADEQPDSDDE